MTDTEAPYVLSDKGLARIRRELDDFCLDMCAQAGKAALLAVLELHVAEEVAFINRRGNESSGLVCEVCGDGGQAPGENWPCPTRVAIAAGLGIEMED